MTIPDDYGRDNDKDDKDEKVEGGFGVDRSPVPGRLDQTGILDTSVAGRTKRPLSSDMPHDIAEPTQLVPVPKGPQPSSSTTTTTTIPRGLPFGGIKISFVDISLTSCKLVAVYVRGRAYG